MEETGSDPNVPGAFLQAQGKLSIIKEQFKQMFIEKTDDWIKPVNQGVLGLQKINQLFGSNIEEVDDLLSLVNKLDWNGYRFIKIR